MPSSIASTRALATGFRITPNSPQAPVKSRCHNSWPREPSSAGKMTSSTSGRSRSQRATASALCVCRSSRTASVRKPRSARKQSSLLAVTPMSVHRRCSSGNVALGAGHPSDQHIGVAAEVLGAGVQRDVGAARKGGKPQRRRPGVVEQHQCAAPMRDLGDRGQVLHLEGERPGRFGEHDARARPHLALDGGAGQRIVVARLDPEASSCWSQNRRVGPYTESVTST